MSLAVGGITKKLSIVKALSSPQSAFFRALFFFLICSTILRPTAKLGASSSLEWLERLGK